MQDSVLRNRGTGTAQVLELATRIRTPMMLSGLSILILFLIYRQLLKSNGEGRGAHRIRDRVATNIFVVSMTATVLGFLGFVGPPLLAGQSGAILYGRVHTAGIQTQSVPGAVVFLELDRTREETTDTHGEFAFELRPSELGRRPKLWATKDGFEPSTPEPADLTRDPHKVEIQLKVLTPAPAEATSRAVGAGASGPSTAALKPTAASPAPRPHFYFMYGFQPDPGRRDWTNVSDSLWIETYPNGRSTRFPVNGRATIDDCPGTLAHSAAQPDFEVFIPDRGCTLMWTRFRVNNGQWSFLGEMHGT